MENFKLQLWKTKLEKRQEPSNKFEITGFYTGKNSKLTGSFSWGFSSIVCVVLDHVAKLVLFVSVVEADDSPAPTLGSSLLSPLLPPPLILRSSRPNSCVTDSYWFSSISHFAMFTKSINGCTISFGAYSRVMHWQPAVFTVLMNWLLDSFVSCQ